MTRTEHLQWCKERALEYLPEDPHLALISMFSDLSKHDETKNHAGIGLGVMQMAAGFLSSPDKVRNFIEGFN